MSDRPRGEGWWLAADGKWYPPESRAGRPEQPGEGWWLASDGNWYPPEKRADAGPATPTSAAPGPDWWLASDGNWYPPETRVDTAQQPGAGWWMASDGNWYPPETRPPSVASPDLPGDGAAAPVRITQGTTTALRYFLYASSALALFASVLTFNEIAEFQKFIDGGPTAALVDAENASETATTWFTVIILATGVLFLAWLRQAYKAIIPLGATGRRWSPNWAVGSWFVPLANFVLPKLVINEIDRVSSPDSGPAPVGNRWRDSDILTVGSFWWGIWLLGGVVIFIGTVVVNAELEQTVFNADRYQAGLTMRGIGYGFHVVSALLATRVVRSIGDRLGPVAPAAPDS